MTAHTPLRVLLLALAIAGCGGGGGSTETSTQRELLRDVPELRAASEGYGGEGSSESSSAQTSAPASRGRGGGLPVGFDGTEMYSGRFGGPDSAQSLSPECPGWVASQPNHEIYVPAELEFAQLVVNSDPFDTTLVVQLPDGSFLCNDDTHGLNPAVQLEPVPSGQLRVWVGSYQEGQEGDYQMAFTTDRGLDASAIGPTPEE
ncbi:MAG: hypothetical protein IPG17_17540 [Sandaracinaceae bacterium]|jgi:hypothetical protein|nr:hypothetical protein [Sandaracinaceae bacterium]MBK6813765.1 hypothetical protein [Sandaracinaceae bacterium]MBK7776890.1 hypothetical protein [Sandaracinaceae bacterium]MBK8409641.1 hypothetical protein [Sandaracinaceae bacterium]MBP7684490.1 hypothetical protein [Deltaproteobacteria bacterium]